MALQITIVICRLSIWAYSDRALSLPQTAIFIIE